MSNLHKQPVYGSQPAYRKELMVSNILNIESGFVNWGFKVISQNILQHTINK